MRIAIVTDSTADLPTELAEKYQIRIVPAILVIEGREYPDGVGITREAFYQDLPHMKAAPTTAAASSGSFEALYAQLLEEGYEHIVSIHAASKLSALHTAARIAADRFLGRVDVVDSQSLSLGLGFQVLAAAEAAAEGAGLTEVLARVHSVQGRVRVVAMLDTMEYLRRSGRVSWAKANLGNLLQLKLFIDLKEGVVNRMGMARTRAAGISRLVSFLQELGPLERLAVLHTNAEREARKLLDALPRLGNTLPLVINVTTLIGTHVGPRGLGFAAVTVKAS